MWVENPSKGTSKRKIFELLTVNQKDISTSTKGSERLIPRFCDNKRIRGIPN